MRLTRKDNSCYKLQTKSNFVRLWDAGQMWWHMPFLPAPGRQRKTGSLVSFRPAQNEFQDSQDCCTEKLSQKAKPNQNKTKQQKTHNPEKPNQRLSDDTNEKSACLHHCQNRTHSVNRSLAGKRKH